MVLTVLSRISLVAASRQHAMDCWKEHAVHVVCGERVCYFLFAFPTKCHHNHYVFGRGSCIWGDDPDGTKAPAMCFCQAGYAPKIKSGQLDSTMEMCYNLTDKPFLVLP